MSVNTIKYLNGTHSDNGCSDLRCPYNQYGECLSNEPCSHANKEMKKNVKTSQRHKSI